VIVIAQLLFYDDKHVYELDGVKLPSVSEILRFISREVYNDISQFTLDNAAERGKAVHRACEQILKYKECEITDDNAGYIKAFVSFLKVNKVEPILIEKALANEKLGFAGTIDLYCGHEGINTIIDIKTVSVVIKPLISAQLNLYKMLLEHNNYTVGKLYCLQLKKDGKYTLYPVAINPTVASACLTLHKAMEQKFDRGKI